MEPVALQGLVLEERKDKVEQPVRLAVGLGRWAVLEDREVARDSNRAVAKLVVGRDPTAQFRATKMRALGPAGGTTGRTRFVFVLDLVVALPVIRR